MISPQLGISNPWSVIIFELGIGDWFSDSDLTDSEIIRNYPQLDIWYPQLGILCPIQNQFWLAVPTTEVLGEMDGAPSVYSYFIL